MSGQWSSVDHAQSNGDIRATARRQDSQSGIRRVPSDAWNIMSDSEETKVRRASVKMTNANASRKRSRNTLREKSREKPPANVDDSAWIHRDKLAQIEIKEMQEAGIDVTPYRRSMSAGPGASARSSRSQSRSSRRPSKDQNAVQAYEDENGYDEYGRKRISTIPAADEEEQDFDPNVDAEFRTPEEVAAEQGSVRSNNVIRPSTSRIPVSKASPVPVPFTVVDRDSPLPRSRGNSNAYGSANWDEMQYARKARSGSMGNDAVFVDDDGIRTPPRPESSGLGSSGENTSPRRARVPTKATPTSGARKSSAGTGSVNKQTPSGNKENVRPVSRGHQPRPSTSSRAPEGDPPWIATMYKPDPRLPPDQQMLPTHAKRMMQDQWEKEGKSGTAYDRDLRPINDNELPPQPAKTHTSKTNSIGADFGYLSSALNTGSPTKAESPITPDPNAWPLTPKSDTPSRPGTSGGYKITPTITTPPPIKSPIPQSEAPIHNPTPRVPDLDEKDEPKQKGGCGCCVVM
jgi:hypothetical protein